MKTPDEIKKGLWVCNSIGRAVKGESWCKENCPYMDETFGCGSDYLLEDALAYIQQLEADNAQLNRCIENMTDKLNAAHDETVKLQAEREQAVDDLKHAFACFACKHLFRIAGDCGGGFQCEGTKFEWRGVQKEE